MMKFPQTISQLIMNLFLRTTSIDTDLTAILAATYLHDSNSYKIHFRRFQAQGSNMTQFSLVHLL